MSGGDQATEMLSLTRALTITSAESLSVAMETNGTGFHGYIVELPGAYVRGPSEVEALSKAPTEAGSYLAWLGQKKSFPKARIVQSHRCRLMVEDADNEILLDDDSRAISQSDFQHLVELATYSGLTFTKLYDSARLKDWVDEARIRTTFYGDNKKTINEIFYHVKRTQYYYLSRTGPSFREDEAEPFMNIRNYCLETLDGLFRENGNAKLYGVDDEKWTLKKVLRRFIWHDRIHGKAITRILEKQRQLRLIDKYQDPFQFSLLS